MDILAIQGSAVPCERVFSSAKETITARRNRMSPELMEALQMLKFSLTKGRFLNFTAGTDRQSELELMEVVMSEETLIPADMTSYLASLLTPELENNVAE